jgi:hypothetical protein
MFKKLLRRSGFCGGSRMTPGLSSVGPPPTLMMIQLFASATIVGSPARTISPPRTSL